MLRHSFEEELAAGVLKLELLDPSRREPILSPVNEEEEHAIEAQYQQHTQNNPHSEQGQQRREQQRQPALYPVSTSNIAVISRPPCQRRATDPIAPVTGSLHLKPTPGSIGRSRARSPYSRNHLRSRSSTAIGHPMTRAFSSPLSDTVPELSPSPFPSTSTPSSSSSSFSFQQNPRSRPESPLGTPYGRRASPRRQLDESFPYSPSDAPLPSVPTIEENVELSLPTASPTIPEDGIPVTPSSPFSYPIFPRPARRRPSSPLHLAPQRTHSPSARILHTSSSVPTLSVNRSASAGSSYGHISAAPAASPVSRYNESYPTSPVPERHTPTSALASSGSSLYSLSMGSSVYSGGSMPSTPTSMRSRSPSISSLDTIPDSPDAEAEAIEQERIDRMERLERLERLDKLRAMVGTTSRVDSGSGAAGTAVGVDEPNRRALGAAGSTGKERKRWSVCGAERRSDLEMETIWED